MNTPPVEVPRLTVGRYLSFIMPDVRESADAPAWPPDVFAVAASLLKRTGAYVQIVNRWPPPGHASLAEWVEKVQGVGSRWRSAINEHGPDAAPPAEVTDWWNKLVSPETFALAVTDVPDDEGLVDCLASLVAASDEACWGVGTRDDAVPDDMHDFCLVQLERDKPKEAGSLVGSSLCRRIDPATILVLPKQHTPLSGITIRSLSHNLALWDRPEVTPFWSQLDLELAHGLNVLVLPWPMNVMPKAFQPCAHAHRKMPDNVGSFRVEVEEMPGESLDAVAKLVQAAERKVGTVDAIIFPELSMTVGSFRALEERFKETLIVAGVGGTESRDGHDVETNRVMFGMKRDDGEPNSAVEWSQHKHHRWRLDMGQIERYGLGCSLGHKDWWWESIHIPPRQCTFVNVNAWLTFCILICEDLARQDPVAELVRTVGPNLIIALLMDGPQLKDRWSARYATVLADDPRCSILTLTCAGLTDLSNAQGSGGARSVALWKDAVTGVAKEITLDARASGVVLTLTSEMAEEWSADGRSDKGPTDKGRTGYLRLTGIHQVEP